MMKDLLLKLEGFFSMDLVVPLKEIKQGNNKICCIVELIK